MQVRERCKAKLTLASEGAGSNWVKLCRPCLHNRACQAPIIRQPKGRPLTSGRGTVIGPESGAGSAGAKPRR